MNSHRLALRTLLALSIALSPLGALGQDQPNTRNPATPGASLAAHAQIKTFYLKNVTQQNDANEIMVAVRNVLDPGVKIYYVASQQALVIDTDAEQMAKAEALIRALDLPRKTYRVTYTITELDGDKAIGTEHFSMVVADGGHTTTKEGNKIPVATGSYTTDNNSQQTQFTYLDIGMNFDSTLNSTESGAFLKTKVEQSSLGQPSTIAGIQEPVVRQTVLEGNAFLTLGKPVMLGSVDVPNSTHRFDIAVVLDNIK